MALQIFLFRCYSYNPEISVIGRSMTQLCIEPQSANFAVYGQGYDNVY